MSYLELAKKAKEQYRKQQGSPETVGDPTEGEVVAVLICSHVLEAEIWLALRNDFQPGPSDSRVVFFADEIPFLKTKSVSTLREIHAAKLACGGGRVRQ